MPRTTHKLFNEISNVGYDVQLSGYPKVSIHWVINSKGSSQLNL
jgi:hypothetical protein